MKKEADFDKKYTGDRTYNYDQQEGQDGFMETFSPHIERVLELANSGDPRKHKRVWTVIDGDDDKLFIVAGYHLVNRVMYFISNEQWEKEDEEYIWFDPEE